MTYQRRDVRVYFDCRQRRMGDLESYFYANPDAKGHYIDHVGRHPAQIEFRKPSPRTGGDFMMLGVCGTSDATKDVQISETPYALWNGPSTKGPFNAGTKVDVDPEGRTMPKDYQQYNRNRREAEEQLLKERRRREEESRYFDHRLEQQRLEQRRLEDLRRR